MTVVVVDDDLGVRRGLARPVDDAGICLVLDIHLGRMSGLELADCLDEQGRSVPIVFMSAEEGALPEPRSSHRGTIAFLRKPFDESELLEAVSRARDACREVTPAV